MAQRQQGHATEYQLPNIYAEQQECDNNAGSVGSGFLTKTASDNVVQQGAVGKYATIGRRRKRGGKHVRDKQKRRMGRKMEVKVGTLNVGTMTGKGR